MTPDCWGGFWPWPLNFHLIRAPETSMTILIFLRFWVCLYVDDSTTKLLGSWWTTVHQFLTSFSASGQQSPTVRTALPAQHVRLQHIARKTFGIRSVMHAGSYSQSLKTFFLHFCSSTKSTNVSRAHQRLATIMLCINSSLTFFFFFFFFFFGVRSNFNKLKTPDQWLWTCRQCWVHNTKSTGAEL